MHKVIFDTDPGVDDSMALVFQTCHPQIELIGVTSVFGNATIEMVLDFAGEFTLERPAPEPVEEPDHRLPSSKIRLTAPDRRAQLSFSTASWRRPAGVRE